MSKSKPKVVKKKVPSKINPKAIVKKIAKVVRMEKTVKGPNSPKEFEGKRAIIALIIVLLGIPFVWFKTPTPTPTPTLRIGLIAELTGEIPAIGSSSNDGFLLAIKQINEAGGVSLNGQKYPIQFKVQDNEADVSKTGLITQTFIDEGATAIIGPNASRFAIPAAAVAEKDKTVLIAPWSTDPKTTLDETGKNPTKYIFRIAFTDIFQSRVLAKFAFDTLNSKKAAILYEANSDVLKGQSDVFAQVFESLGGKVVTTQTYPKDSKDFKNQLDAIKKAKPDIIFLPSYYNDAAAIIKQAHKLNLWTHFLGSDAWGSDQLLKLCGKDCENYYFGAHFAVDSKEPMTKKFVEDYKTEYGKLPDDVAALNYDAVKILAQAAQEAGSFDKDAIRNALAHIKKYQGVTGTMQFDGSTGDPIKSAVILQIRNGNFVWSQTANP